LTTWLRDVPGLQDSRLWVRARYVNKRGGFGERMPEFELDGAAFRAYERQVRNGQFFTGHLRFSNDLLRILRDSNIKIVFMVRNPLDILVSQFHYIKGLKRHSKHDFFTNQLSSDSERIRVLLHGNTTHPYFISMKQRLANFLGWLETDDVFIVRFEDVVGTRGGGDDSLRSRRLSELLEFAGLSSGLDVNITPPTPQSATFRNGRSNAWRDLLDESWFEEIQQTCGRELDLLGYPIGVKFSN